VSVPVHALIDLGRLILHSSLLGQAGPVVSASPSGSGDLGDITLQVARQTLTATIIAILISVVALAIAVIDALNNRRQLALVLRDRARMPALKLEIADLRIFSQDRVIDGRPCFEVRLAFIALNDDEATGPATNVKAHIDFPKEILTRSEWNARATKEPNQPAAPAGNEISDAEARGPKHYITSSRLAGERERFDGDDYHSIGFYHETGLTLLIGERSGVSDDMLLYVPETSRPIRWSLNSLESRVPARGTLALDLARICAKRAAQPAPRSSGRTRDNTAARDANEAASR